MRVPQNEPSSSSFNSDRAQQSAGANDFHGFLVRANQLRIGQCRLGIGKFLWACHHSASRRYRDIAHRDIGVDAGNAGNLNVDRACGSRLLLRFEVQSSQQAADCRRTGVAIEGHDEVGFAGLTVNARFPPSVTVASLIVQVAVSSLVIVPVI